MQKEWIEVIDTAVKIGLGSLITGYFMQRKIKSSYKNDHIIFSRNHKIQKLEKISEHLEVYFNSVEGYASKISGIARHRKNNNTESTDLSEKQKAGLKRKSKEYEATFKNRRAATANLNLLKADKVNKALVEYVSISKKLRNNIVFEKKIPTHQEIQIYRKKIYASKKIVLEELSILYDELLTP